MSNIKLNNISIDEILLNKIYYYIDNGIYENIDQVIEIALNKLLENKKRLKS